MTAQQQVEASTVRAAGLFSNNSFEIPDFQRDYSWRVEYELEDFWRDLSTAIDQTDDYFLGLLILTDAGKRREVVDGQQRLITLSLLANALRLAAIARDRKLVAETLQNTFLYSIDYQTEKQIPRLTLTDLHDSVDFAAVVKAPTPQLVPSEGQSLIIKAHKFLEAKLEVDLATRKKPELRLGQWAEFITDSLKFTVFAHPDRSAAFRVFEVINTRGKILTPAELIKSYLIGSSPDEERTATYERWRAIEQQFDDVGAEDQLTVFVRHIVELRRGYVVPRELYQIVTREFAGPPGVSALLDELEEFLPVYIQMIDPSSDVESSELRTRVFMILSWLSGARFRPLFLAAIAAGDERLLQLSLDVIAPGILSGSFGSGSVEAQVARAARRLHQREADWGATIQTLRELLPSGEEFEIRLRRNISKAHAQVLRSAITQDSSVPEIVGYAHQVRPRQGQGWPAFTDSEYKSVGSNLANWLLIDTERRPQGTRTPTAVKEKLIPHAVQNERVEPKDLDSWTAAYVAESTKELAKLGRGIWYGDS